MSESKIFIGIDPGKSGAWAMLTERGTVHATGKLEFTRTFILELKANMHNTLVACIEQVHAMPKQGTVSTFSFGESYGIVQGILQALCVSFETVTPGKWQKTVLDSVPAKAPKRSGDDKKADARRRAANQKALKEHITAFVVRKWPKLAESLSFKENQGIADAVCIAEYCRLRSRRSLQ